MVLRSALVSYRRFRVSSEDVRLRLCGAGRQRSCAFSPGGHLRGVQWLWASARARSNV
jgi:hypothetical protein